MHGPGVDLVTIKGKGGFVPMTGKTVTLATAKYQVSWAVDVNEVTPIEQNGEVWQRRYYEAAAK